MMTPQLAERVIARLRATGAEDETWALMLLAAMEGAAPLDGYLDDGVRVRSPAGGASGDAARSEPPGVYLASMTVDGFRGIGPSATLALRPGPGLTLVAGRNGSGKSSFAEGLEFLLTGRNYRWDKRPKVWEGGWRNLHKGTRVALKADLVVEGQGPLTVSRTWTTDDDLSSGDAVAQRAGAPAAALDTLGWKDALATFRPFLSYNELGSLLDEGPSKLYDALSGVLGLEELTAVQKTLAGARLERQNRVKAASAGAGELLQKVAIALERAQDDRLLAAERLLKARTWDVAALQSLVRGQDDNGRSDVRLLKTIAQLVPLDESAVAGMVKRLRASQKACDGFAGTNANRARELARLLEAALGFHEKHESPTCPVCGTADALGASWKEATKREIATLKEQAGASLAADSERDMRVHEAQKFLNPPPPVLAESMSLGLTALSEARRLWSLWTKGREIATATALAGHLETYASDLATAQRELRDESEAEARRREDLWAPIAIAIAEWLPKARSAQRAASTVNDLKRAEAWWKEASAELRDERFAPVAERAIAIWKRLRLQSNVDLGGIDLEGSAQRRRVSLSVTVDGTPAEALGVMSQGELHALALSLFLPRATLPESPFRFLSIDDPVQSMDPARVEGLARVLADVAHSRQVIVFTHDDRLPEAVRRLGIPATVYEVARRTASSVEVRRRMDPVQGYLDDARAVAATGRVPAAIASRVVPNFCRLAIEAACMGVVRRRRLGRGEPHDEVETLLASNGKTHPLLALALFDDEKRTGDVLPRLQKLGPWAADVLQGCKAGSHTAYSGDVSDLVRDAERLADQIVVNGK